MQTIFEIFDPVTGTPEGYKDAKGRDTFLARMDSVGYVRDYLPAQGEGFYVVDMRGAVKSKAIATREQAQSKADYENQCSDTNSFHVVEHKL